MGSITLFVVRFFWYDSRLEIGLVRARFLLRLANSFLEVIVIFAVGYVGIEHRYLNE